MIRANAVAIVLLCAAAAAAPAAAQAAPPSTGTPRTVTIRGIRLGPQEAIAVLLHPSVQPIELRADTPGLEVCPGLPDGGSLTWPSVSGFTACRPIEHGRITLPSVVIASFHLGITVRPIDRARTRIGRLTLDYQPTDGFFIVVPPAIPPTACTATVTFTPVTRSPVSVQDYTVGTLVLAPHVRVTVTQRGQPLPRSATPADGRTPAYGPARAGKPVTVRACNRGTAPAPVELDLSWE